MLFAFVSFFFCCAAIHPLDDVNIEEYDMAFVGKVIEITDKKIKGAFYRERQYHFEISEAFKGTCYGKVENISSNYSCIGLHAKLGEEWLILAQRNGKNKYVSADCAPHGRILSNSTCASLDFLRNKFQ